MDINVASTVPLQHGGPIPILGLGVYLISKGHPAEQAVRWAVEAGYRHVDTASLYGNEQSVGLALSSSGLNREDYFVTTKLWNSDHGYDKTLRAFDASLSRLGLEYVDLYLVHWPVRRLRLQSWKAVEEIFASGRARAIGVSNYVVRHLEELLANCRIPPAVNQLELHPYNYLSRLDTVTFCREQRIAIEAYSPLTHGERLNDPRLAAIARKYGKSPAQLLIRLGLQQGFIELPKSTHRDRIRENAQVFDFEITPGDMRTLDELDEALATDWDPTNEP